MEEFKTSVVKEIVPTLTNTEKKISELKTRAKKFNPEVKPKAEKPEKISDKPLKKGDPVRMKDTLAAGEVIEIRDGMVQVETGSFRFLSQWRKSKK